MKRILESFGVGFLVSVFVISVSAAFMTDTTTDVSLIISLCIALFTGITAGIMTYKES